MSTNKREYDRLYYANRSKEAKDRKVKLQRERVQRNREIINAYKHGKGCSCGETHIACLEFHHFGDDKEFNLGDNPSYSIKKIFNEIEKCILICSNCHRKLHYDNRL